MKSLYLLAQQLHLDPDQVGIDAITDADGMFTDILALVYIVAGIVAVMALIYGGFVYSTSSGNPASVKRGKDVIIGALIGIIVVIMAFVITQFILGRF